MEDIKTINVDGIDYAIKDEVARTSIGELSKAVDGLSNQKPPVQRIESLDESNLANLRDLESGSYVLYGYFRPYAGAAAILPFDNLLVNVFHVDEGSHLFEFSTANSEVNFIEILVDETADDGFTYTRTPINLLELHGLKDRVAELEAKATAFIGKRIDDLELLAENWQTVDNEKHIQEFSVATMTLNTEVTHAIDDDTVAILQEKEISLSTKNVGGKVVVTATGAKPTMDYTIQIKLEEVTWL